MLGGTITIVISASATTCGRASCVVITTTSGRRLSRIVPTNSSVVEAGETITIEVLVASDAGKARIFWRFLGYCLNQCVSWLAVVCFYLLGSIRMILIQTQILLNWKLVRPRKVVVNPDTFKPLSLSCMATCVVLN